MPEAFHMGIVLGLLGPLDRLRLGYEALNRGDLSEVVALVAIASG
jgi:hypothetical protein